jgi:hypothetical protein
MASRIRQGLLPVLGAAATFLDTATKPKNRDAYDLYLGSVSVAHDTAPNRAAIAMLEQAVHMDPTYAPAIEALGYRYYFEANYAGGGVEMYQRATSSLEQALALDPDRIFAAGTLIQIQVERGDLGKAYDRAEELVKRRPESAQAHFTLSYVLRYAGMLEQSAHECDTALALDPGNYVFRSCAWALVESGRTQQAMDFVRLDAGSEWAAFVTTSILLREGKIQEARQSVTSISDNPRYHRNLLEACLQVHPSADLDKIAQETEKAVLAQVDPEQRYYQGSILAFCGKPEIATRLIRSAIDQNYCSGSALRADPLLAKLRGSTAFGELQTAAADCQQKFLAQRGRTSP